MPVIDMPLDELLTYQGKSPFPNDFDDYWQNALRELKKIDANIELQPADFQSPAANCYNLFFTGLGNARIHAKVAMPKNISGACPGILKFHGYRCNSGEWTELLPYAASGFVIASMDCRGQSGLSEDNLTVLGNTAGGHIVRGLHQEPEKLYYRNVFLDTAQLARIVMDFEQVDAKKVAATGWSQGGALTIACAALEPRINSIAPVYPFLSDYKRVWEMDLCTGAYIELRDFFRWFDPLHEKEDEIFHKLGYIDIQNLANRISARTLFTVTLRDDICPPSSQFATYNKIKSTKQLKIYHDFGHESLRNCQDMIYQFMMEM